MNNSQNINELLTRGVDEVLVLEHLRERLERGDHLRVKFGIDPTSAYLHLGHTVALRKLRQFQDAGHQAVLIIGDETAMIGDPTGRSQTRTMLTREVVAQNQATYLQQASKILHVETLEVHYNSEWFGNMSAMQLLEVSSLMTVSQMMQRADFKERVQDAHGGLAVIELLYPIMQGYDSVQIKADVELGGVDQKLNVVAGRHLQKKFGQEPQDVLTVPLLLGTDGDRKMSKSFENSISLESGADDLFGRIMSIPDHVILSYFTLLTDVSTAEINSLRHALEHGENPKHAKERLGWELTKMYHCESEANRAKETFASVFARGDIPHDVPQCALSGSLSLVDALVACGFAISNSDARRLIQGAGVKLNGETVTDHETRVAPGALVQKGKRYFVRFVLQK